MQVPLPLQKIALSAYFNILASNNAVFRCFATIHDRTAVPACHEIEKHRELEHHRCNSEQLINLLGSLSGSLWLSLAPIAEGGIAQFLFDFVRPICTIVLNAE